MNAAQRELAKAASGLTPKDLEFLEEHDMLPGPDADAGEDDHKEPKPEPGTQHDSSDENEKGKRRKVEHEWPEVGAVLEADYKGTHYEAEVISMPRYKSDRAVKILSGPAEGEVERSMSGAMLTATEEQREENDLDRKGVSNGWEFWEVKEEGGDP